MPDIETLRQRTINRIEGMRINREGAKILGERQKLIDEAPQSLRLEFWCDQCQRDCTGIGYKVVRWHQPSKEKIAYYIGKCPVNHKVVRFITDKLWDPYYVHSRMIQTERRKYAKDLLRPGDPGFDALYGKREEFANATT